MHRIIQNYKNISEEQKISLYQDGCPPPAIDPDLDWAKRAWFDSGERADKFHQCIRLTERLTKDSTFDAPAKLSVLVALYKNYGFNFKFVSETSFPVSSLVCGQNSF